MRRRGPAIQRRVETCTEVEAALMEKFAPGDLGVLNPSPMERRELALIEGPAPAGMACQRTDAGTLVGLPLLRG